MAAMTLSGAARRSPSLRPRGLGRAGGAAAHALALPLAQAPEVAADLPGVDLTAGEMHVGRLDQAALVAGERHPLGQDVVGVGQPRAAVGPRLVGELDAVLVDQPARLGQVADDRLVGIDQVGVGRAGMRLAAGGPVASLGALSEPAPHAQEAEVAVHLPVLGVDAGAQQLAGALLGAAFAARVVARDRDPLAPGLVALVA